MTEENFTQRQIGILAKVPPRFRMHLSYWAWNHSHAFGYDAVIETLADLVDEVMLPALCNDTGVREVKKMNIEPNIEYVVTKSSNRWFTVGEVIVLKNDGCIYIDKDVIEPEEVETAMQGMECRPYVPSLTETPDEKGYIYDFLIAIHNNIDGACHECDSRIAKQMLAKLIAKFEKEGLDKN